MTTTTGVWLERGRQYALLARLHRPIGNFLLLWPTLWALWLAAGGWPDLQVLVVFVLGVLVMRAAGCVINDYADRNLDGHVERTRDRPMAQGRVSGTEALILFAVLCLLAFGLVLLMNRLTILLSLVGVLLAASYPFMKRYTHVAQLHLGVAFGWAVPMAFAAQTGQIDPVAWWLFAATVIWALVYDTQYAMVDRDDDIRIGIKSTAILFGRFDRLAIGVCQLLMLSLLLVVGWQCGLGTPYWLALVLAGLLFIRQQWLIRDRQRAACFRAFLDNNWLGGVIFAGVVLSQLPPGG